jgi:hypothetical protein
MSGLIMGSALYSLNRASYRDPLLREVFYKWCEARSLLENQSRNARDAQHCQIKLQEATSHKEIENPALLLNRSLN